MNINAAYRIFLIGDGGKPAVDTRDEVFALLEMKLKEAGKESAVIFLGDNIYPRGMPPEDDPMRSIAEKRLNVQLDIVKDHPGKVFFISGNHDWNKGRDDGYAYMCREEKYVEHYLGRENVYLPANGCLGPVEVDINEELRIIFINTQWFMQKGEKPFGSKYECEAENGTHFFRLLEKMLGKNNKATLLVGHHPMYSKALHGGHFNYRHHLFPLRVIHKKLFIPLPLLGTIYPLYRKVLGTPEDMAYPPYQQLRKKLLAILVRHPNLIYAAGHDHNLQYIYKEKVHYLISGSASSAAYVSSGGSSIFTYRRKGFLQLDIAGAKKISVAAWSPHPDETGGEKLAEMQLKQD